MFVQNLGKQITIPWKRIATFCMEKIHNIFLGLGLRGKNKYLCSVTKYVPVATIYYGYMPRIFNRVI